MRELITITTLHYWIDLDPDGEPGPGSRERMHAIGLIERVDGKWGLA